MDYPGRTIKAGESNAEIVRYIAQELAARGYSLTSPQGTYDAAMKSVVSMYQAQNFDRAGRPLEVDGEVGPMTWGALFGAATTTVESSSIAVAALGVAVTQLGVMEVPLGSNKGPMVNQYLASVGLDPGYYWCMAFIYWCFKQAATHSGEANPFPRTAGCLAAWNKVKASQPQRLITRAQAIQDPSIVRPGMVFILDYGRGAGHTGFVRQGIGGALRTVEGNTNNGGSNNGLGVFELNRRKVTDSKLKGFINFS
jgi:hypothetical protein